MKISTTKYSAANKIYKSISFSILGIAVLLVMGCGNKKSQAEENTFANRENPASHRFSKVAIPQELKNPHERANYLMSHYWDNFDFSDTSYIHLPAITEQAFAEYINLFEYTNIDIVTTSIDKMLSNASEEDKTGRMYSYFLDLFKKYLYDPNSPTRNDEYYIPVVNHVLADNNSSEMAKEKAKFARTMMFKNRKGEFASDFKFTTSNKTTSSLYKYAKMYTLLYFYNPECSACKETALFLKNSPIINNLVNADKLEIIALFPDNDISIWKKHASEIPPKWINGYDNKGLVKSAYDLRAIPSLYLLDSRKKVLLKDIDVRILENYLNASPIF